MIIDNKLYLHNKYSNYTSLRCYGDILVLGSRALIALWVWGVFYFLGLFLKWISSSYKVNEHSGKGEDTLSNSTHREEQSAGACCRQWNCALGFLCREVSKAILKTEDSKLRPFTKHPAPNLGRERCHMLRDTNLRFCWEPQSRWVSVSMNCMGVEGNEPLWIPCWNCLKYKWSRRACSG